MFRPLLTAAFAALSLMGCAELSGSGKGDPESAGPRENLSIPDQLVILPVVEPERPLPPTPRRKPHLPDVSWQIDGLIGMDFVGTEWLLGAPALETVQPPAKIWSYNGSGCVLNIFFYPQVNGGEFRALTYEVKGAQDSEDLSRRCFSELMLDRLKARVR